MALEDNLDLDSDAETAVSEGKSKSKLLIIIGVAIVFLGISATATLFLTGMLSGESDSGGVAEEAAPAKASEKDKTAKLKAPLNYVPMDPPFVVNFSGDSDIRFLQITLEVGTRDPDMVERIKEQRPLIRNSLVMLFSNQDPVVLNTREGKEQLRSEALAEIRKVMKQETGSVAVENVFFTSFVMQ